MNEEQLGDLLASVDDRPPAGGPDTGALLAGGRARARRRRRGQVGLTVTAIAAVVAATATAATAWPGHHGAGNHRTPTAGTPRPATPVPTAPARYDPLVRTLEFGAVPDSLPDVGYKLRPTAQTVFAQAADNRGRPPVNEVELEVHVRGWNPDQPDQGDDVACARGAQTSPVNGHTAYLAAQPDRTGHNTNMRCVVGLVWEYAPGSWAEVRTTGDDTAARQRMARDIAASARFGLNMPLTLPFTLASMPEGMHLYGAEAYRGPQPNGLRGAGGLTLADAAGKHVYIGCGVNDSTRDHRAGAADREVNGHPALYLPPDQLFVFQVGGCEVTVEASGRSLSQLAALAALVHPVGDPADTHNWTASPLP